MSTDFFSRQDQARKHTGRLVVCLVLGMAALTGTAYALAIVIWNTVGRGRGHGPSWEVPARQAGPDFWNPGLFLLVAGAMVLIVAGASWVRTLQLSAGGGAGVAEGLGGREIFSGTLDPDERKLLNVVEEMALAASCPMPRVFVMDAEDGINAFAAGWAPESAVIGVTRGAIARLSRDELQGVIGHEFSHIVNGDMRMNIRLMGLIFGLLALVFIGRILLEIGWWSRPSRDEKKGDPRAALALIGLVLLVLGWLGSLFGQMMQAAISRQREFLADASAVQFTRNPQGLANALKKIGAVGCEVSGARAKEASHMFFSDGSALFGLFATHPPLEERIKRLDPGWDGAYPGGAKGSKEFEDFEDRPSSPEASAAVAATVRAQDQQVRARRGEPTNLREWADDRIARGFKGPGGAGVPLEDCVDGAALALTILARCAGNRESAVAGAFSAGAQRMGLDGLRLAPPEECRLSRLDSAIGALSAVSPEGRARFLAACAAAAGEDGRRTPLEAQLLGAYAAALG